MNLSFVEAFYWAATLKSVSRAAKKLYITQSAASSRIAVLERELEVPLLDRRDHHFGLTVAGQRFLRDAAAARPAAIHPHRPRARTPTAPPAPRRRDRIRVPRLAHSLDREHEGGAPRVAARAHRRDDARLGELVREERPTSSSPRSPWAARTSARCPSRRCAWPSSPEVHSRRGVAILCVSSRSTICSRSSAAPIRTRRSSRCFARPGSTSPRVHAISSISAMLRLAASGFGVATCRTPCSRTRIEADDLRVLRSETELAPLPIHASWRVDPSSDHGDAVVESITRFAGLAACERPAHA